MNIREMHYEFVLRTNKIDSLSNKEFTPLERDSFLNEAITAFVNRSYNGTNAKGIPFEATQEMLDELRTLVVNSPIDQPWLAYSSKSDNAYVFDLSNLKYEYLHLIRVYSEVSGCSNPVTVNMVQYDDLNRYLTNALTQPNKLWKRLIGVIANDKLIVYSTDDFVVEQIAPSYIKAPAKVSLAGYTDINGVITTNVDCDLANNTHSKIIDLAVLIAQGVLENQLGYQVSQQKIVINS